MVLWSFVKEMPQKLMVQSVKCTWCSANNKPYFYGCLGKQQGRWSLDPRVLPFVVRGLCMTVGFATHSDKVHSFWGACVFQLGLGCAMLTSDHFIRQLVNKPGWSVDVLGDDDDHKSSLLSRVFIEYFQQKKTSHSTLRSKGNEKLVPTQCPRVHNLNKKDERGISRQPLGRMLCWNKKESCSGHVNHKGCQLKTPLWSVSWDEVPLRLVQAGPSSWEEGKDRGTAKNMVWNV